LDGPSFSQNPLPCMKRAEFFTYENRGSTC